MILSFKVTRDLTFVVAEDSVGFNEQSCRQNSQTGGDADDQPVLAEVGVDQLTKRAEGDGKHEVHRDRDHECLSVFFSEPCGDSEQRQSGKHLVCSTENRPNREVRTDGHVPGQSDRDRRCDVTVAEESSDGLFLTAVAAFDRTCNQFLEDEAAETGCGVKSSERKGGNRQSNELLRQIEIKTQRCHEGCSALREGVDRAAGFQESRQFVSSNVSDGNDGADCQEAFNQHGAVADELGVLFVIKLLGAGTGANQRMEAGNRTAGNSNEQNREEPLTVPEIKAYKRRNLHGRLIEADAEEGGNDHQIKQEGVQVVARLQKNPNRCDGGNKDVAHHDQEPHVFRKDDREDMTDVESGSHADEAQDCTEEKRYAGTVDEQAESDSKQNEE